MNMFYLDNAATTPMDKRVLEAMLPYLKEDFGNPSSIHSYGRKVKVMLEEARDTVADFIGAEPSEIYFTSGGTEANNMAVKGIALAAYGRKNHIICSKIEHPAVLDPIEYLVNRFRFDVTYIDNDKYGRVDLEQIRDSITDKTVLVCVMHSNNELGIINDISAISDLAVEKGIYIHTDSVQSIGKTNFNVNNIRCSACTLSAHKIYGPKGIGAIYIKKGTVVDKLIHGGKQEHSKRGGTENIASIAGFKKAVEILKDEMSRDINRYKSLRQRLLNGLKRLSETVHINSLDTDNTLPNIISLSFSTGKLKIDPETILIKLDLKGLAVSSGSACTSGAVLPSHVLKAIGYDDLRAKTSLRISIGRFNNENDVDYFLKELSGIIKR
jgi:cysteine desulfurase